MLVAADARIAIEAIKASAFICLFITVNKSKIISIKTNSLEANIIIISIH